MVEIIEPYIERIGQDWIDYFSAPEEWRDTDKTLFNPFGIACELVEHSMFKAWELIHFILDQDRNGATLGLLSASLLEDFISFHGPTWIDEIEEEAIKSSRFRSLLAGVWQSNIEEAVWARVVSAKGDAKPFD